MKCKGPNVITHVKASLGSLRFSGILYFMNWDIKPNEYFMNWNIEPSEYLMNCRWSPIKEVVSVSAAALPGIPAHRLYLTPDIWYLITGTWYLIRDTWYTIPGTWFLKPDTHLVPDIWYLITTWYQVPHLLKTCIRASLVSYLQRIPDTWD